VRQHFFLVESEKKQLSIIAQVSCTLLQEFASNLKCNQRT
jgi:hypothetical protein